MPHLVRSAPRLGRRAAAVAGTAGLLVLQLLAPATALVQPLGAGGQVATPPSSAAAFGSAVTVHGPHMYDPKTKTLFPQPSTVTVSQTTNLVNQMISVSWSWFTPSNNQGGGAGFNPGITMYPVQVSECPGTSPGTSPADLARCYGGAGQGTVLTNGQYGPTTAVYATTAQGTSSNPGTGAINIQIQTTLQNQGLGCDVNHPCSLLILPAEGGYPGVPGPASCADHKQDAGLDGYATAFKTYQIPSTQGGYDTCSWADRIVIPLHFAPTPANCGFSNATFTVAGSPMMERAMTSWQSAVCHGRSPIDLSYDGTISEPQARTLFLSGANDVALTTEPASGPSVHPYTYAPVGISAAVVAYWFDNAGTSLPYPGGLKLDPRLMAKLITQSYGYGTACTKTTVGNPPPYPPGCDPAVMYDPLDLLADPEFRALNPHINVQNLGAPRAVPTVQGDNSDMTWEVTRWVAADQGATQFLTGQTDPYGEHVNTYYLGAQYPVQRFAAQDPKGAAPFAYIPVDPPSRVALYQVQNWWPGLDWTNPVLGTNGQPIPGAYHGFPVQAPGIRSLLAIMDNADASAFLFPAMALENHAGRFVTATPASMAAAVGSMTAGPDGITRDANMSTSNPTAYPLTMVSYAMVPTGGISHAKAVKIAQWLDFVAGQGQVQGSVPGQLPSGYLPLPSGLRKQTLKAAYEVLHQTGNHSSGQRGGNSGNGTGNGSGGGSPGNGSGSKGSGSGKGGSAAVNGGGKVNAAYSNPMSNAFARLVVPLLLALGTLLALGGSSAVVFSRPGARAAVVARWRRLQALTRRQPAPPEGT